MENLSAITLPLDVPTKEYVDSKSSGFYAYSGRWGPAWSNPKGALAFNLGSKWICAYRVSLQVSIQSIAIENIAAAAGGTCRICVYSDANPWPGSLLNNINVTMDAIGIKIATMSIGPGSFWLAVQNSSTPMLSLRGILGVNPYTPGAIDTTGASAMTSGIGYNTTVTTAPATWPVGSGTDLEGPAFLLRAT